ncbi:hypothetical protein D9758_008111 [Tetrapyrgos nigripes]|uniref:Uncharacterized protein n=1 Tax=Tetrapyrgos nigripes TaxID=182062 RepID=A0A8H5LPB1_9AGAR|nr:hypothetical protein D9758_008111 [Tetrapyrgos nigripes]
MPDVAVLFNFRGKLHAPYVLTEDGKTKTSSCHLSPVATSLICEEGKEIETLDVYDVKALNLPEVPEPFLSTRPDSPVIMHTKSWFTAALSDVSRVLIDNLSQLMLQAYHAFCGSPNKEVQHVIFQTGYFIADLLFPRPTTLELKEEHLEVLPNGSRKIADDAVIQLFPYDRRPICVVPLTPIFTFDDTGRITGFTNAFFTITRRNIRKLAPKALSLQLEPVYESLQLENPAPQERNWRWSPNDALAQFNMGMKAWYQRQGVQFPDNPASTDLPGTSTNSTFGNPAPSIILPADGSIVDVSTSKTTTNGNDFADPATLSRPSTPKPSRGVRILDATD